MPGFLVAIAGRDRLLPRSLESTITRPGNPQEAAFANGYKHVSKGLPIDTYGRNRHLREWFRAGKERARYDQRKAR